MKISTLLRPTLMEQEVGNRDQILMQLFKVVNDILLSNEDQDRLIYDTQLLKYILICLPFLNNFLVDNLQRALELSLNWNETFIDNYQKSLEEIFCIEEKTKTLGNNSSNDSFSVHETTDEFANEVYDNLNEIKLLAQKHQRNINRIVEKNNFTKINASYALHVVLEKSSNPEIIQLATEISKEYMRNKSRKNELPKTICCLTPAKINTNIFAVSMEKSPKHDSKEFVDKAENFEKNTNFFKQLLGNNYDNNKNQVYSSINKKVDINKLYSSKNKKKEEENPDGHYKPKKSEQKKIQYGERFNELLLIIWTGNRIPDKEIFRVFDNMRIVQKFTDMLIIPKDFKIDSMINKIFKQQSQNNSINSPTKGKDDLIVKEADRAIHQLSFITNKENVNNITTLCESFLENFISSIKYLLENKQEKNDQTLIIVIEYLIMLEPKFIIDEILTAQFLSFQLEKIELPQASNFLLNLLSLDDRFFSFKMNIKRMIYTIVQKLDFLTKIMEGVLGNQLVEFDHNKNQSKEEKYVLLYQTDEKESAQQEEDDQFEEGFFEDTDEPRYGRYLNYYLNFGNNEQEAEEIELVTSIVSNYDIDGQKPFLKQNHQNFVIDSECSSVDDTPSEKIPKKKTGFKNQVEISMQTIGRNNDHIMDSRYSEDLSETRVEKLNEFYKEINTVDFYTNDASSYFPSPQTLQKHLINEDKIAKSKKLRLSEECSPVICGKKEGTKKLGKNISPKNSKKNVDVFSFLNKSKDLKKYEQIYNNGKNQQIEKPNSRNVQYKYSTKRSNTQNLMDESPNVLSKSVSNTPTIKRKLIREATLSQKMKYQPNVNNANQDFIAINLGSNQDIKETDNNTSLTPKDNKIRMSKLIENENEFMPKRISVSRTPVGFKQQNFPSVSLKSVLSFKNQQSNYNAPSNKKILKERLITGNLSNKSSLNNSYFLPELDKSYVFDQNKQALRNKTSQDPDSKTDFFASRKRIRNGSFNKNPYNYNINLRSNDQDMGSKKFVKPTFPPINAASMGFFRYWLLKFVLRAYVMRIRVKIMKRKQKEKFFNENYVVIGSVFTNKKDNSLNPNKIFKSLNQSLLMQSSIDNKIPSKAQMNLGKIIEDKESQPMYYKPTDEQLQIMDKVIHKVMGLNGVDLQKNELRLKFKCMVGSYESKLNYEVNRVIKSVTNYQQNYNNYSKACMRFVNSFISDSINSIFTFEQRKKFFKKTDDHDCTLYFNHQLFKDNMRPMYQLFGIYLARLNLNDQETIDIAVNSGENLNKILINLDKLKLNKNQCSQLEIFYQEKFPLQCLGLIDLSQKKIKQPKLKIQSTSFGKRLSLIQITLLRTFFIICENDVTLYKLIYGDILNVVLSWTCQGITNNMILPYALKFIKNIFKYNKLLRIIQIFMQYNLFHIFYKTYNAFNSKEAFGSKLDKSLPNLFIQEFQDSFKKTVIFKCKDIKIIHVLLNSEKYCFMETKVNGNGFIKQMINKIDSIPVQPKKNINLQDTTAQQGIVHNAVKIVIDNKNKDYIFGVENRLEEQIKAGFLDSGIRSVIGNDKTPRTGKKKYPMSRRTIKVKDVSPINSRDTGNLLTPSNAESFNS